MKYNKETNMSDRTSIFISDVDKSKWKKFRGTALMKGFDSGADYVRTIIQRIVDGELDVKK